MKKMIYLVIIGFVLIVAGNSKTEANSSTDFMKLVEVLQSENVSIQEWSILARGQADILRTKESLVNYVSSLKEKLPHIEWEITEDKNGWKAIGLSQQSGIKEKLEIMTTPKNSQENSYILYEVTGNAQLVELQHLNKDYKNRIKDIFRQNPTIFTCIKGEINDTLAKVLSSKVDSILEGFQAKEVESLREENFVSVSAHSPLFTQFLNEEQLNLQIAMRTQGMGGRTTIVVGTPIITFEY
ncbi:YwmB family TATA-box binding protein [Peribacillus acanthi]|uniref:YwmB family TATA-box binding protein n=1 Tax=Peribacillus acanthi TaxID=2171554 RepID=UPI000D3E453B|nr:YwmB family TATA-box binding protein [Peribacillus acanthi]